jgi:hypothetical protein
MASDLQGLLEAARTYGQASSAPTDFIFRVSIEGLVILDCLKLASTPFLPPESFMNKSVRQKPLLHRFMSGLCSYHG